MTIVPDAMLIVSAGIPSADHIPLTDAVSVLGKSSDVDITIDNPFVSRRHCQIRFQDHSFHVSDLGSKNGTYVNGVRLCGSEEKQLRHNDAIGLAENQVTLRFHYSTSETSTMTLELPSRVSGLRLDSGPRDVYIADVLVAPPLSRKEFDVLELLYQNQGDAVSRDDIVRVGWPERTDGDVGNQEIEQCVRRIRRRIEPDPANPRYVITVRGYGFKTP
ncbi:FHA domain-containing protein [Dehalococcoidia bacterium]|nr:FHA domain-containing protein [Dehalococcoidia bacterium]